jgi:hypothetical protein
LPQNSKKDKEAPAKAKTKVLAPNGKNDEATPAKSKVLAQSDFEEEEE